MRAIRTEQDGGPEVLRLEDIPVPVPGEGEVLVRIAHASIDVMDVGTRKGAFVNSDTTEPGGRTCGSVGRGTGGRSGVGDDNACWVATLMTWSDGGDVASEDG